MPERLPSDHASVRTVRGRIERSGGMRRPCLRLPADIDVAPGDYVRVVLDGDQYHARVRDDSDGVVIRGAYDNRRLARDPESDVRDAAAGESGADPQVATNRLVEWFEGADLSYDSAVEVDEVVPGFLYGVRVPGARTVYAVPREPDDSLSSIAERLDDG